MIEPKLWLEVTLNGTPHHIPLSLGAGFEDLGEAVVSWSQGQEDGEWQFEVQPKGEAVQAHLSLCTRLSGCEGLGSVFVPGAVADGNRFRTQKGHYPPLNEKEEPDDEEPVISAIPRLQPNGEGGFHLLAGGASYPAITLWQKEANHALRLSSASHCTHGETGLGARETAGQTEIFIDAPSLRATRYRMMDDLAPSPDQAAVVVPGAPLRLRVQVKPFPCPDSRDLNQDLKAARNAFAQPGQIEAIMPLAHAARLVAGNLDTTRYSEQKGFYFDSFAEDEILQPGWTGGGMLTLPLLATGTPAQQERVRRTLDFIISHGLMESGLYAGYLRGGVPGNDGFEYPHAQGWHLLRKSGDMALFLIRQARVLEKRGEPIPENWSNAVLANLDCFCQMWRRDGRWGQFVEADTRRIVVGGESAAGSVIAALAEGWAWLGHPEWREVAQEAGRKIASEAIRRGTTVGGPGEILKAPDSESSFGLLEGLVSLWEATGEPESLALAESIAHQAITWVVSYDYAFPPASTFAKMGMQSTGTVIASAQNKHSSPGICTFSSLALLKVGRAVGDFRLQAIAAEIAQTLPQYVSSRERPIRACNGQDLPSGWICERVNMSDWELGGIGHGEIFYGSCWPETSVLLSAYEMPSVLFDLSARSVLVADHCRVTGVEWGESHVEAVISNPTPYDAPFSLAFARDSRQSWGEVWDRRLVLSLAAGESRKILLD